MKIIIGYDHIAINTEMILSNFLKVKGHEILDMGTYNFTRTHYPIYRKRVEEVVVMGKADLEVCLCGTGVGINSVANKTPGIRSALIRDMTIAICTKEQLGADVIGLGARTAGEFLICGILDAFAQTEYQETDENQQLIIKIKQIEKANEYQIDLDFSDEFIERWNRDEYQNCEANQ